MNEKTGTVESKPTSEGARLFELMEELRCCSMSSSAQVRISEARDLVASLRSQLAAAEGKERTCKCFWCHQEFPYPYKGTPEERADALTAHAMGCKDNPIHRAVAAESEIQRLRERITELGRYAHHDPGCPCIFTDELCNCGLSKILPTAPERSK